MKLPLAPPFLPPWLPAQFFMEDFQLVRQGRRRGKPGSPQSQQCINNKLQQGISMATTPAPEHAASHQRRTRHTAGSDWRARYDRALRRLQQMPTPLDAQLGRAVDTFALAWMDSPQPTNVAVVCLGLGSLRHGSNSMIQLGVIESLSRALAAAAARVLAGGVHIDVSLFDPDFDDTDLEALRSLGYSVLTSDGRRDYCMTQPGTPTLFYLPHCDHHLMESVLAANWHRMHTICLMGNSFSWIREHSSAVTAQVAAPPHPFLLRAVSATALLESVQQPRSHSLVAKVIATEHPLALPRNDSEWEAEFRALDCTSVHVFTRTAAAPVESCGREWNVLFVLCGTRGDVEPCVRLAQALANYVDPASATRSRVRVLTHAAHKSWVEPLLSHASSSSSSDNSSGVTAFDWLAALPARTWRGESEFVYQQAEHEAAITHAIQELSRLSPSAARVCFNLFALEAFHVCEASAIPCVALSPYRMPHTCPVELLSWLESEWPEVWGLLNGTAQPSCSNTSAVRRANTADVLAWQFALFNVARWERLRGALGLPEVPYIPLPDIAAAAAATPVGGGGDGAAATAAATTGVTAAVVSPAPAACRRSSWADAVTPLVYGLPQLWEDAARLPPECAIACTTTTSIDSDGSISSNTSSSSSSSSGNGTEKEGHTHIATTGTSSASVHLSGFWACLPPSPPLLTDDEGSRSVANDFAPVPPLAYHGHGPRLSLAHLTAPPLASHSHDHRLPRAVLAISDGAAPCVLFSLGSMVNLGVFSHAELRGLKDCFRDACRLAGARGLLLMPGQALEPLLASSTVHPPSSTTTASPTSSSSSLFSDTAAVFDSTHGVGALHTIASWLECSDPLLLAHVLPRCAAIVHHGGSGTVAAALVCGTPQVTLPCIHDQFENAMRCRSLGVAPSGYPPASMWELLDSLDDDQRGGDRGVRSVAVTADAAAAGEDAPTPTRSAQLLAAQLRAVIGYSTPAIAIRCAACALSKRLREESAAGYAAACGVIAARFSACSKH